MRIQEEIDFVITWVDGSDKAWLQEKSLYDATIDVDNSAERYRDWELLKYWFRGIEKFAPWVRMIHFVTWGHVPKWLSTEHPKLHVVKHEEFIPKEYLPTFNSAVIELYLHKIEGLSDKFVYFNDDFFVINHVKPKDYFKDDKPCDMLAFQPVVANPRNPVMSHIYMNNSVTLCKYFNKRENVKKHPGNYFHLGYPPLYFCYNILEMAFPLYTGFYTVHNPSPFTKATFEEIWAKEKSLLEDMSTHRFRNKNDVSPYLFREWQKLSNQFVPTNVLNSFGYFEVAQDNHKLVNTIKKQKKKMICINDAKLNTDFEHIKKELQDAFEVILPEVSSFER